MSASVTAVYTINRWSGLLCQARDKKRDREREPAEAKCCKVTQLLEVVCACLCSCACICVFVLDLFSSISGSTGFQLRVGNGIKGV